MTHRFVLEVIISSVGNGSEAADSVTHTLLKDYGEAIMEFPSPTEVIMFVLKSGAKHIANNYVLRLIPEAEEAVDQKTGGDSAVVAIIADGDVWTFAILDNTPTQCWLVQFSVVLGVWQPDRPSDCIDQKQHVSVSDLP